MNDYLLMAGLLIFGGWVLSLSLLLVYIITASCVLLGLKLKRAIKQEISRI